MYVDLRLAEPRRGLNGLNHLVLDLLGNGKDAAAVGNRDLQNREIICE